MAETAGGPDTASNPMTTPATGRLRGDVETSRPLRLGGRICGIEGWCLVTGESSPPPVRLRTGTATLSFTVPVLPALVGDLLHFQVFAAVPGGPLCFGCMRARCIWCSNAKNYPI